MSSAASILHCHRGFMPDILDFDLLIFSSSSSAVKRSAGVYMGVMSPSPQPYTVPIT